MQNVKITEKGTELPLLTLKGKPYLQVAHRLVWFREVHPFGMITTEVVEKGENYAIVKARVQVQVPGAPHTYVTLSEAHKKEQEEHFGDYTEKAETGAIGRALAMAGYGTQFDPELDEGDRIVDSPIAAGKRSPTKTSAGETRAREQAAVHSAPAREAASAASGNAFPINGVLAEIGAISRVVEAKGVSNRETLKKELFTRYGVQGTKEMTETQKKDFLGYLKTLLN